MAFLNANFVNCLAKYTATKITYDIAYDDQKGLDELSSIMDDSVITPLKDLMAALSGLKGLAADQIKSLANFDLSYKNILFSVLKPFASATDTLLAPLGKENKDNLKSYLEQEGFMGLILSDPESFAAVLLISILKGASTIDQQKYMLQRMKVQIRKTMEGLKDAPEFEPPTHPFNNVSYHIAKAKNSLLSVSTQIASTGAIDKQRYDNAEKEVDLAIRAIETGQFTEDYINDTMGPVSETGTKKIGSTGGKLLSSFTNKLTNAAGVGKFIQLKNNNGQISFVSPKGLTAMSFLPPVQLTARLVPIKAFRKQIASYNVSLIQVKESLTYLTDTFLSITDMRKFLSILVQYVVVTLKNLEEKLGASAGISPWDGLSDAGTVVSGQVEAYSTLQAQKYLLKGIQTILNQFNGKDVNQTKRIKGLRDRLHKMDLNQCVDHSALLDREVGAFISSFNRRMANKVTTQVVKNAGFRALKEIDSQLVYLDCFKQVLSAFGFDKIPTGLLKAMGAIGAIMAAIPSDFAIPPTASELKRQIKAALDPKPLLLSSMKSSLQCMKDSCNSLPVQNIIGGMLKNIVTYERTTRTNFSLASGFSRQAKYNQIYSGNKLTAALEKLSKAIQRLSC